MTIISQETWDNLPSEEKDKITHKYHGWSINSHVGNILCKEYEELFGKENLQSEIIAEKCVKPIKEHFDMETQNTEWNMCTEQEQQNVLEIYNNHPEWTDVINALENKFGKHNLQPKPKIRTWSDVEKEKDSYKSMIGYLLSFSNDVKLNKKLAATLQIQKLIELGYGGTVTAEEWKKDGQDKGFYSVWANAEGEIECTLVYDSIEFISFHTRTQAEEFISYPENRELVKMYHLL